MTPASDLSFFGDCWFYGRDKTGSSVFPCIITETSIFCIFLRCSIELDCLNNLGLCKFFCGNLLNSMYNSLCVYSTGVKLHLCL